ncbi:peptide-methionine (S)-S-oxide reductase MsrA [Betaproteobacteria bacterium PRO7]|jgi:peptide-methionine (S)-S-oxide reductase|nr:peptide-methionine (S)-S-oxide reductase MsrA [Betaproteobacteria bacterium PRO7]
MNAHARWIGPLVAAAFAAAAPLAQAQSAARAAPVAKATFAGGCFWCVEADFDRIEGVLLTTSGYIGGRVADPTYEQVSAGGTGHAEAVEVVFDPRKVSYAQLVDYFWRTVDPTVKDRQFCDVGSQYRTGIFVHDEAQRRVAEASKSALERTKPFKAPIVTEIAPATTFYPAEEYHQDYYRKNPIRYKFYRANCGRDARLKQLWGEQAGKPG